MVLVALLGIRSAHAEDGQHSGNEHGTRLRVSEVGIADGQAHESRYGGMLDLGVPDGLMASFVYRPHTELRALFGIGHNSNSPGLRAGLQWSPWQALLAPYLALEAGHYFRADTPDWMRDLAQSAGLKDKTLESVGYQYGNGHLGVAIGGKSLRFCLQMGVSFVRASTLIIKPKPNYTPPVELYRETTIHAWLMSGRAGLLYTF